MGYLNQPECVVNIWVRVRRKLMISLIYLRKASFYIAPTSYASDAINNDIEWIDCGQIYVFMSDPKQANAEKRALLQN